MYVHSKRICNLAARSIPQLDYLSAVHYLIEPAVIEEEAFLPLLAD